MGLRRPVLSLDLLSLALLEALTYLINPLLPDPTVGDHDVSGVRPAFRSGRNDFAGVII
jgi:hypothetical protein